jgi:hypothetical protein
LESFATSARSNAIVAASGELAELAAVGVVDAACPPVPAQTGLVPPINAQAASVLIAIPFRRRDEVDNVISFVGKHDHRSPVVV